MTTQPSREGQEPVWTVNTAMPLVFSLWERLKPAGYHIALTGSLLYQGHSFKDLDLIVYPNSNRPFNPAKVFNLLLTAGLVFERRAGNDFSKVEDDSYLPGTWDAGRAVNVWSWKGKRIDVITFHKAP